jgi:chromosomal replication initiation ATPase DnaA
MKPTLQKKTGKEKFTGKISVTGGYQNTELKNINMEFVQMTAVRVRRVNRRSEEQKALDIIDMVASYYQVDKSLFYKRFKPRYISERKHMILWLLRKHTKLNVVQIGKLLGIHYSIVSTGSRNFLNLMDIDSNYKKEVREIEAQIL